LLILVQFTDSDGGVASDFVAKLFDKVKRDKLPSAAIVRS
jgi:hypothetical protein